ncbi:radical SAM protein [Candidatus Woesearchaeota archaeon]|nr:radical SAM protein [Candidatus Woesearchaeota archaeon]
MARLTFHDLKFRQKDGRVTAEFLGNYEFEVGSEALSCIGDHEISENGSITLKGTDVETARRRLNAVIDYGLASLVNITTRKRTLYVHRYSGIPLIGNTSFGIIDRNTSMIEVRPITGCNMNCIFCSVDEGLSSRKTSDVVVEEEYLAAEVKKLVKLKGCDCSIIINAQGEPVLYKPLPKLVKDLKAIAAVKTVTLITNGTLLTEKLIDELADAGLTRINISLNAIEPKVARVMEGHGGYDVEKVKKMAAYASKTAIRVTLAPVIVKGYNDEEMERIVKFAKETGAETAMQSYLPYKRGRNPKGAEQMPWQEFYEQLQQLERQYDSKLVFAAADYSITKTKPLPKPFRKGQTAKAVVVAEGRYPREYIAAAMERIITLPNCEKQLKPNDAVKVKIVSDKHNIFYGKLS